MATLLRIDLELRSNSRFTQGLRLLSGFGKRLAFQDQGDHSAQRPRRKGTHREKRYCHVSVQEE